MNGIFVLWVISSYFNFSASYADLGLGDLLAFLLFYSDPGTRLVLILLLKKRAMIEMFPVNNVWFIHQSMSDQLFENGFDTLK